MPFPINRHKVINSQNRPRFLANPVINNYQSSIIISLYFALIPRYSLFQNLGGWCRLLQGSYMCTECDDCCSVCVCVCVCVCEWCSWIIWLWWSWTMLVHSWLAPSVTCTSYEPTSVTVRRRLQWVRSTASSWVAARTHASRTLKICHFCHPKPHSTLLAPAAPWTRRLLWYYRQTAAVKP